MTPNYQAATITGPFACAVAVVALSIHSLGDKLDDGDISAIDYQRLRHEGRMKMATMVRGTTDTAIQTVANANYSEHVINKEETIINNDRRLNAYYARKHSAVNDWSKGKGLKRHLRRTGQMIACSNSAWCEAVA